MKSQSSLRQVLEEQVTVARAMLDALDLESEALKLGDTDSLNEAGEKKAQLTTELESLEQERQLLLQTNGSVSETSAENSWQQLLELMAECQERNRRNGGLVQWRREHIARALRVLQGEALEIYDASGLTGTGTQSNPLGKA